MAVKLDFNKAYDRIEWDFLAAVLQKMGFKVSHPSAKYLGLPSFWGRSKAEAYDFLIEKVVSKLQGWKMKLLSQAAREILIKAVVQAIPSYAMACFAFPKKFCAKLNSYIRRFWWGGELDGKGIHWVRWDQLVMSKLQGGLGFRDFQSFNLALLARQDWRLLKYPHSLSARILKGIYFPHSSFMLANKGRASWAWASILQGRELLKTGVRWQVNDGSSIRFWEDKWVPPLPNFTVTSMQPVNCEINRVADAIDNTSKSWKLDALSSLVSASELKAISSIPIALAPSADSQVWHFESKGSYSVSSGYHTARSLVYDSLTHTPSSSFQPPRNFWKHIWALKVPPKIRHFWWRVCKNALASRENLVRRRCAFSNLCPICQSKPESVEHLLFGCNWVRAVWFGSNLNFRVNWSSIHSVLDWSCAMMEQFQNAADQEFFFQQVAWTGWFIWKGRNDFMFNNQPIDPLSVLSRVRMAMAEFESATGLGAGSRSQFQATVTFPVATWVPPSMGTLKINCDVAVKRGSNLAAVAAVLRDSQGQLIDGITKKCCVSSSFQGEALACRLACQLAQEFTPALVVVESDNKNVIHLCVSEDVPPWECGAIIHDIKGMAVRSQLSFQWCPRAANGAAHWVAQAFLHGTLSLDWVSNPHSALRNLCNVV